jgi:hypothetical protein
VTTEAARAKPRRRPRLPRPPRARPPRARNRPSRAASLFDPAIARRAVIQAFVKLDPRVMIRIPVAVRESGGDRSAVTGGTVVLGPIGERIVG